MEQDIDAFLDRMKRTFTGLHENTETLVKDKVFCCSCLTGTHKKQLSEDLSTMLELFTDALGILTRHSTSCGKTLTIEPPVTSSGDGLTDPNSAIALLQESSETTPGGGSKSIKYTPKNAGGVYVLLKKPSNTRGMAQRKDVDAWLSQPPAQREGVQTAPKVTLTLRPPTEEELEDIYWFYKTWKPKLGKKAITPKITAKYGHLLYISDEEWMDKFMKNLDTYYAEKRLDSKEKRLRDQEVSIAGQEVSIQSQELAIQGDSDPESQDNAEDGSSAKKPSRKVTRKLNELCDFNSKRLLFTSWNDWIEVHNWLQADPSEDKENYAQNSEKSRIDVFKNVNKVDEVLNDINFEYSDAEQQELLSSRVVKRDICRFIVRWYLTYAKCWIYVHLRAKYPTLNASSFEDLILGLQGVRSNQAAPSTPFSHLIKLSETHENHREPVDAWIKTVPQLADHSYLDVDQMRFPQDLTKIPIDLVEDILSFVGTYSPLYSQEWLWQQMTNKYNLMNDMTDFFFQQIQEKFSSELPLTDMIQEWINTPEVSKRTNYPLMRYPAKDSTDTIPLHGSQLLDVYAFYESHREKYSVKAIHEHVKAKYQAVSYLDLLRIVFLGGISKEYLTGALEVDGSGQQMVGGHNRGPNLLATVKKHNHKRFKEEMALKGDIVEVILERLRDLNTTVSQVADEFHVRPDKLRRLCKKHNIKKLNPWERRAQRLAAEGKEYTPYYTGKSLEARRRHDKQRRERARLGLPIAKPGQWYQPRKSTRPTKEGQDVQQQQQAAIIEVQYATASGQTIHIHQQQPQEEDSHEPSSPGRMHGGKGKAKRRQPAGMGGKRRKNVQDDEPQEEDPGTDNLLLSEEMEAALGPILDPSTLHPGAVYAVTTGPGQQQFVTATTGGKRIQRIAVTGQRGQPTATLNIQEATGQAGTAGGGQQQFYIQLNQAYPGTAAQAVVAASAAGAAQVGGSNVSLQNINLQSISAAQYPQLFTTAQVPSTQTVTSLTGVPTSGGQFTSTNLTNYYFTQ